jgi:hypothetical protein
LGYQRERRCVNDFRRAQRHGVVGSPPATDTLVRAGASAHIAGLDVVALRK